MVETILFQLLLEYEFEGNNVFTMHRVLGIEHSRDLQETINTRNNQSSTPSNHNTRNLCGLAKLPTSTGDLRWSTIPGDHPQEEQPYSYVMRAQDSSSLFFSELLSQSHTDNPNLIVQCSHHPI